jgi:alpha-D-ribose 1-methylphosphonate 5-triphosphate diphosphatase
MSDEIVFTGGRLVLPDLVTAGTLVVRGGRLAAVEPGRPARASASIDLEGDLLIPGLVELHTDRLETHLAPRPGVRWPARAAVVAHDREIVGAGITTVFDAVSVGSIDDGSLRQDMLDETVHAIAAAKDAGMLAADHLLHLRCEIACADVVDLFDRQSSSPLLRLVSLMDHTPGQRQFADIDKYRFYYQRKWGFSDESIERFIVEKIALQRRYGDRHRAALIARCQTLGFRLASHDDATEAHVGEAVEAGVVLAEFPTTVAAARASRIAGIAVMGGAPNVVRGGSHSGNVSVAELARQEALDVLSSDYFPAALLHAAFALEADGGGLARTVALATLGPATAMGLDDRGALVVGRRADLVRVRLVDGHPVVRGVWVEGERAA